MNVWLVRAPGHKKHRSRGRRWTRRLRFPIVFIALLALITLSGYELLRLVPAVSHTVESARTGGRGGIESYEPAPDYRAARPIYPYSVVPGGVRSAKEVQDSIDRDPVVRAHYAGLVPATLLAMRLSRAIDAYASYRVGNRIYWTAHKIHIPSGELVLSDGTRMIRSRCGNVLTFIGVPPIFPDPLPRLRHEPPPAAPPPGTPPPDVVFDYGMPPILWPPEMPVIAKTAPPPYWPPPVLVPPYWCCENTTHARPPATPEPSTFLLLGTAASAVFAKRRLRDR